MTKFMIAIASLAMMNNAAHSQTTVDQWIALCSKGASASCDSPATAVASPTVRTAVLVIEIPFRRESTKIGRNSIPCVWQRGYSQRRIGASVRSPFDRPAASLSDRLAASLSFSMAITSSLSGAFSIVRRSSPILTT
jgi:hypothetical protein